MSVCGGLARHLNQRVGFLLAAGIAAPLNGAESAVPERYSYLPQTCTRPRGKPLPSLQKTGVAGWQESGPYCPGFPDRVGIIRGGGVSQFVSQAPYRLDDRHRRGLESPQLLADMGNVQVDGA